MSHLVLLFLSFISLVSADFAGISELLVYDPYRTPVFPNGRVIAMYNKEDSPAGDTDPYIEIDLVAKSLNETKVTGFIEVIILQAINIDALGFHDNDAKYSDFFGSYCCSQAMYEQVKPPGCTSEEDINTLLIDDGKIHHEARRVNFTDQTEVKIKNQLRFSITTTGEHILILSNCHPELSFVQVDGEGEWRNPYGYLPGRLYGYLEFYGYMSIVYLVIGLIWFIFNAYYWTEVVMVQNCITVVLAMCMAEMTVWYFEYKSFNDSGKRDVTFVVIGIMFTVSRQTLSRMLVLAVSLGWGVVRPTLGKNKFRLIILGFTYWLSETAFELVTRYSQTSGIIPERIRMFLALPVAVLNAIFYWWIFIALYRITAQLEARRQESKLMLYRRFTRVLIFSLIVTVGFAIYQLYYMYTDRWLLHWSQLWLLDVGFPDIVYTIILTAIAILWRPSQNSRRYAYAEVARGTEDDGEFGDLELDDVAHSVKQHDPLGIGLEDDSDDDNGPPPAGRFTVDEDHDNMHQEDPLDDMVGINSQPMTKLA